MPQINVLYQPTPKSIGGFAIDAFLSESYQFTNDATDIPVEEGVSVTDHVLEKPDVVQISAFIGRAEFAVYEGGIPEDFSSLEKEDKKARIRRAYLELRRMKSEKIPVTVVMGLDTFNNMIITSFNIGRDAETGADLSFDMTFQELKKVKNQSVAIDASILAESSAMDQAAPTTNTGTTAKNEEPKGSDIEVLTNEQADRLGIRGDYIKL
jgi:hypothetical protein